MIRRLPNRQVVDEGPCSPGDEIEAWKLAAAIGSPETVIGGHMVRGDATPATRRQEANREAAKRYRERKRSE